MIFFSAVATFILFLTVFRKSLSRLNNYPTLYLPPTEVTLIHSGSDSGSADWVRLGAGEERWVKCSFGPDPAELDNNESAAAVECHTVTGDANVLRSLGTKTADCSDCDVVYPHGDYGIELYLDGARCETLELAAYAWEGQEYFGVGQFHLFRDYIPLYECLGRDMEDVQEVGRIF